MSFYINVLNFFLPEPAPLFDVAPGPFHEGSDVDGSTDQRISGIAHVRGQRQTPLQQIYAMFFQNCDNGNDSIVVKKSNSSRRLCNVYQTNVKWL